jgi:hypothetical protein
MAPDSKQLADAVQRNCHISDARHAGNYTLCVYLLKMREFYRWEKAHRFSDELSSDDIGKWLTEREDMWSTLEQDDYADIEALGQRFNPYDASGINARLLEHGLVYSGGIGQKSKPHFFLAELERREQLHGYEIIVSDREFARDLTSPPAMSQGNTIFIRRESFKRMLWEKIEEWRWNQPQNAMAQAMACYDFENDVEAALARMTDNELEAAILHEIGEIKAGADLPGWSEMMHDISYTQAEIMARAVRDHIADAISTLPALLENKMEASIHFYFANLTQMRKHIMPSLQTAYLSWRDIGDSAQLQQLAKLSHTHWQKIAAQMLALHKQHGKECHTYIEALVEEHHL